MTLSRLLQQNLIGKLFNHSIVFLINILIVRMLGAESSGHYFNELYIINFFIFLASAGLDYAAIAWIARQPELSRLVFEKLLRISLFVTALFMAFALLLLPELPVQMIQSPWAMVLFGSGNLMLILFQGILSAQKKFNQQNLILIITNLTYLILLFFVFQTKPSNALNIMLLGYGLLFFLQGLLVLLVSFKKQRSQASEINWNKFYRHGLYIMLSSLIYFCFLRADNFFVEKYADPVTLSNYVQCGKIGQYFLYFSSVISSTMLPFIISENISADYSAWKKLMMPYVGLICVGASILMIAGPWIYPWVFGADFDKMHSFMLILLPGYVCLGVLTLINAIYIGKGNLKKIFRGDLAGLLILLIADSFLVPRYGAQAAAAVSSCAYCLIFLYLLADLKNQFHS